MKKQFNLITALRRMSCASAAIRAFGIGAAIVASASALADDYPSTVLAASPIAYWTFNEQTSSPAPSTITNATTLDATGYVVADVQLGQPGIVGTCALFNNSGADSGYASSKIDFPWQSAINPNPPFSIEFWAKPRTIPADSTGICPLSSVSVYFYTNSRSGYICYLSSNGWEMRVGGVGGYAGIAGPTTGGVKLGGWEHIVGEFDGSYIRLFINGRLSSFAATDQTGFTTNDWAPTRIGATSFNGSLSRGKTPGAGNRGWDGWVDEVAIYNVLLTPDQVAAHFAAVRTNNAGYHAQILADNPVAYWPLDDLAFTLPNTNAYPVAINSGSDGNYLNGTNTLGAFSDQPGPPYAGMPSTNRAVFFDGATGSLSLASADDSLQALVGQPITLMAWIKPTEIGGWRTIIEQGWDPSTLAENYLRIGDTEDWEAMGGDTAYYEVGEYSAGATDNASAIFPVPAGDIGNWIFLAGTWDGANWNLYRNARLVAQYPDPTGPAAVPGNPPWSVGSLSNPSLEDGWFFSGAIDEPAIFNYALSQKQITTIYNAAKPAPEIILAPSAPPLIYTGGDVTLSVWAEGGQPISYQWYCNGTALVGETATNITFPSLTPAAGGTYTVVVSNAFGVISNSAELYIVATIPPSLEAASAVHLVNDAGDDVVDALIAGNAFTTDFKGINDVTITSLEGSLWSQSDCIDILGGEYNSGNPSYLTNFVGQAGNGTGDGIPGDLEDVAVRGVTLTNVEVSPEPYLFIDYNSPTNPMQFYRAVLSKEASP